MHPNPIFRNQSAERNIAFARRRPFGVLAVNGDAGPLLAHVPFLLNDDAAQAELHLVRSNPIARLSKAQAVIAVNGPDGYISPDWYGIDDQVPTWNYVAVHLRGSFEPLPDDTLLDMLDRQSADYEARLLPKPPWMTSKLSDEVRRRFLRMIQPFRLHIEKIEGTWKLNQNKDSAPRQAAADAITTGFGTELEALAQLVRDAEDLK